MAATTRRSAFTALELVAVLATTSVVAAVAYSAYRTYRVRAEIHHGLAIAVALAPRVADYFRRHGEAPTEPAPPLPPSAASAAASALVEAVAIVDGRIDVLFGDGADGEIAGRRISLTPYETADMNVVWICGNQAPGPGLAPLGFASGVRQATQQPTTIDARYLSAECR
jgi:type IV pilus assembly protein PilA